MLGGSIAGRSLIGAGGALPTCDGSRSLRGERNASWSGPSSSGLTAGSRAGAGGGSGAGAAWTPPPAPSCPSSRAGSGERPVAGPPEGSCPKVGTAIRIRLPATSTTPNPIVWMRFIATTPPAWLLDPQRERRPMARVRSDAPEGTEQSPMGGPYFFPIIVNSASPAFAGPDGRGLDRLAGPRLEDIGIGRDDRGNRDVRCLRRLDGPIVGRGSSVFPRTGPRLLGFRPRSGFAQQRQRREARPDRRTLTGSRASRTGGWRRPGGSRCDTSGRRRPGRRTSGGRRPVRASPPDPTRNTGAAAP